MGGAQRETPSQADGSSTRQLAVLESRFRSSHVSLHVSSLTECDEPADGDGHPRMEFPLHHPRQRDPGALQRTPAVPPRTTCHPAGAAMEAQLLFTHEDKLSFQSNRLKPAFIQRASQQLTC